MRGRESEREKVEMMEIERWRDRYIYREREIDIERGASNRLKKRKVSERK